MVQVLQHVIYVQSIQSPAVARWVKNSEGKKKVKKVQYARRGLYLRILFLLFYSLGFLRVDVGIYLCVCIYIYGGVQGPKTSALTFLYRFLTFSRTLILCEWYIYIYNIHIYGQKKFGFLFTLYVYIQVPSFPLPSSVRCVAALHAYIICIYRAEQKKKQVAFCEDTHFFPCTLHTVHLYVTYMRAAAIGHARTNVTDIKGKRNRRARVVLNWE